MSSSKRICDVKRDQNLTFFNIFPPTTKYTPDNNAVDQPSSNDAHEKAFIYTDSVFKTDKNMKPCVRCAAFHKKVRYHLQTILLLTFTLQCDIVAGATTCRYCQKHGILCLPKADTRRSRRKKKGAEINQETEVRDVYLIATFCYRAVQGTTFEAQVEKSETSAAGSHPPAEDQDTIKLFHPIPQERMMYDEYLSNSVLAEIFGAEDP